MISVARYTASMEEEWDSFVLAARNSTLLHLRRYMDYHSHRFQDTSLVFIDEHDRTVALLPACFSQSDTTAIVSHEGLTYGGIIVAPTTHADIVEQVLELACRYYKEHLHALSLTIKHIPYIYSSQPCDEECYFIHRLGGRLVSRSLSQAVSLDNPLPFNELRRRRTAKAQYNGITVSAATSRQEWDEYHRLLATMLADRHDTNPVHTADELWLLHSRFPKNIQLYTARKESMLAGTVVYLSPQVAHTQYLAASAEGRDCGALDLVISHLLKEPIVTARRYLDFGISTERDGTLNHGLTFQKEGFGARGVCYDTYYIAL